MDTEKILNAIAEIKKDTDSIRKQVQDRFINTAETLEEHTKQINDNEQRCQNLESTIREKNLIIYGIRENERNRNELEHICLNFIRKNIRVEISLLEIDNIYRLGNRNINKTRPIIIKFISRRKVIDILANRRNLQGTKMVISEDFPKEVIEERRHLVPIMKELRRDGKHAIIKYNKLYVDGKQMEKTQVMIQDKEEKKRQHSDEKSETDEEERNENQKPASKQDPKKKKLYPTLNSQQTKKMETAKTDQTPSTSQKPIFEYMSRPRTHSYDDRPIKGRTTGRTTPTEEITKENKPKN